MHVPGNLTMPCQLCEHFPLIIDSSWNDNELERRQQINHIQKTLTVDRMFTPPFHRCETFLALPISIDCKTNSRKIFYKTSTTLSKSLAKIYKCANDDDEI